MPPGFGARVELAIMLPRIDPAVLSRRRARVADLSRLVFGRLLHVVNDEVINRGPIRLQLESELPLDICENG